MSEYKTKDSGDRRVFTSGSKRDVRVGKGRFDLIPYEIIQRLADLYERGAQKYGDRNWELGQPLSVFLDSAMRHGAQVAQGMDDEDHAVAAAWNWISYAWTEMQIENGNLPEEYADIGRLRKAKKDVPTKSLT